MSEVAIKFTWLSGIKRVPLDVSDLTELLGKIERGHGLFELDGKSYNVQTIAWVQVSDLA